MKTLLNCTVSLAFIWLVFTPNGLMAQANAEQDRIEKYKLAWQDFISELDKMESKLETSLISIPEVPQVPSMEDTLQVPVHPAAPEENAQRRAKTLALKSEMSNLRINMETKYQDILMRAQTVQNFSKLESEMESHEEKMLRELNALTDKMAENEMAYRISGKNTKTDTTVFRIGSSKIIIIEEEGNKKNSYQYLREKDNTPENEKKKQSRNVTFSSLGLSLGLNSFMYKYDLNLPGKYNDLELNALRSWNVNLKLIESKVNLYKHRINLLSGISVDWNNYRFRNNTLLSPRTDTLWVSRDTINFSKNKLMTQTLMGHLMMQFETKPGRNGRTFDVGLGMFGGYLLNARTKQVSDQRGKQKFDDDFQLNNFRYGICARIGYGAIDFYLNYTLNDIFRTNLGPAVQNASFGINFTGI